MPAKQKNKHKIITPARMYIPETGETLDVKVTVTAEQEQEAKRQVRHREPGRYYYLTFDDFSYLMDQHLLTSVEVHVAVYAARLTKFEGDVVCDLNTDKPLSIRGFAKLIGLHRDSVNDALDKLCDLSILYRVEINKRTMGIRVNTKYMRRGNSLDARSADLKYQDIKRKTENNA
jgi:hypothetical protein